MTGQAVERAPARAAGDEERAPAARRLRPGRRAAGLVVPLALLAAWQLASGGGLFTPAQLPSPSAVLAAVAELIRRGELWQHVAISGQRVLL
ncbi:hypothetical protein ACWEPC_56095, partial [Nonomuraea sp. NPDC004297]